MTQFFREFDVNGDGVFDFGEFSKMMHAALDGHGVLDDDPAVAAAGGEAAAAAVSVIDLYGQARVRRRRERGAQRAAEARRAGGPIRSAKSRGVSTPVGPRRPARVPGPVQAPVEDLRQGFR